MAKVIGSTRAGKDGRDIVCPKCGTIGVVYHFAWSATQCWECKEYVKKGDWILKENAASEMGRKGGSAKSAAKTKAARANAKKPRGRWATAISYRYHTTNTSVMREGVLIVPGKPPEDRDAEFWAWARNLIETDIGNADYPIEEILEFATRSRVI